MTDRVPCRTPAGSSATDIPAWMFEADRDAIRAVLAEGETRAADRAMRAADNLTDGQRADLGALGWHAVTVRLEPKVRGEIVRLPGSPLRLRLA